MFHEGRELFLRQDYAAARQTLVRYTRQAGEKAWADEVDYMLACTAYELHLPECREVLTDYLEAHPESRYRNRVQALIAASYFSEEKYMETIATLKGCDISLLSDEECDASALRMGTSYLKMDKWQDATFWFSVLKDSSKAYYPDAVYNLAYIDYVQQKYDSALQGFREVKDDQKFQKLAPYYIADIYLIQNNYAQARKVADAYLALYPEEKNAGQMSRISGEAAYGQKDYAAAIQSLERYREGETMPARLAMYKLGMSYFNTGVYSKALSRLGEATGAQDALAQNAYLHMGLAGLQLKERNQARMAFEQASRMDFDRSIQEQALFNYALCIHETSYSPFAESVTVFERFLNEYPSSVYAEKVNDYLVEVYMNTRSYEVALRSIDKITHPSARILEAKQNCCSVWVRSCLLRRIMQEPWIISPAPCSWDSITKRRRRMHITGVENRNTGWHVIRRLPMTCGFTWSLPLIRIRRNMDWLSTVWDTVCSSRNNITPHATGLSVVYRTGGHKMLQWRAMPTTVSVTAISMNAALKKPVSNMRRQ